MNYINPSPIKAAITAVGAYVPEEKLTNAELENMVDTNDDWIVVRTGIKERRILKDSSKGTSFMAIKAAEDLLSKKNIDPREIDAVILASITPDMNVAATAAYVASEIGATNAFGYDLQAACSGFLYGMSNSSNMIASGRYQKVLLIGADKMSSIIDYSDRTTSIIFGDGAGAVLFEPSESGYGLEDEFLRSDGSGRTFLNIKGGGSLFPTSEETLKRGMHNLYQDGKTVFKYAVSEMSNAIEQILKRNEINQEKISYLVPHQANKRIIDAIAKRIGLPDEKVMTNIEYFGNTTAATLPLLLKDYESKLSPGDRLVFAAFGGGFTWGAAYLTWTY
ncbi:MAG: beta-ketoacyl-ACP synthase III [Bacteroidota bacterium]|nr:beta-ketoacyl-ACP synthase III [Bacteroidota bacterium]